MKMHRLYSRSLQSIWQPSPKESAHKGVLTLTLRFKVPIRRGRYQHVSEELAAGQQQ